MRPEWIDTEDRALREVTAQKPVRVRKKSTYLQKPMPNGHVVESPNVFSADRTILSTAEEDILAVLRRDLPPSGFLPIAAFSPAAMAAAAGQRHTGNMGVIFESLCRKGFLTFLPQKGVFHVKRAPVGTARRKNDSGWCV